jgi:hypothetical protein
VALASALAGHLLAISVAPAWLGWLTGRQDLGSLNSAGMMAASAGLIFFSLLAASHFARSVSGRGRVSVL